MISLSRELSNSGLTAFGSAAGKFAGMTTWPSSRRETDESRINWVVIARRMRHRDHATVTLDRGRDGAWNVTQAL